MASHAGSHQTASSAETERLGAELAATLTPGDAVLIEGELGAGKTTLVRGAARALGVTVPVTSPTFTIGQRYPAANGVTVAHLDLYRIADLDAEDPELLDDYLAPDTVAFVEWPGGAGGAISERRLSELATRIRRVRLSHAGGDNRIVEIDG